MNTPQPQNQTGAFALQKAEAKFIEFVPFGADTKIKLSVKIIQDFVAVKTRAGHSCSERDAMRFMMLCQAQALNPFAGDAYLVGYDSKDGPSFSLITAHQAFLKRAELHPEFDGMESGVVVRREDGSLHDLEGDFYDQGETVVGAWAKVYFKNRKVPMFKKIRMEAFRKNFGVWIDNPEGMLVKCAESDSLRSSFPTKLGGMYIDGEIPMKNANAHVVSPDFPQLPAETAPSPAQTDVPNPELGAKKERAKKPQDASEQKPAPAPQEEVKTPPAPTASANQPIPENAGRAELAKIIRDRLAEAGTSESELVQALVALEIFPEGVTLDRVPSDMLRTALGRWTDALKKASEL